MIVINSLILLGRLTRDPEVKYPQNAEGKTFARFGIAVNRRFKNKDGQVDADFFDVNTYGKTAEFVEKFFSKGAKIIIRGWMKNNNWTDKDGVKHYGNVVIAEEVDFVESKATAQANQQTQTPQPQSQTAPKPQSNDEFMSVPSGLEEDLPFV